jgi:uncharacterized protein YcfL
MKFLNISLVLLIALTISGCGKSQDAMTEEKTDEVMMEESDNILDINLENAQFEIELVE